MSTISVWVRWRQMQEWDTEGQAVRAARLKQSWLVTPCRACTKIPTTHEGVEQVTPPPVSAERAGCAGVNFMRLGLSYPVHAGWHAWG